MTVPEVLLSGDHRAVAEWRRQQSELRSRDRKAESENTEPEDKP
jgi:tRNA (guanine37-N1)-methyltransferase